MPLVNSFEEACEFHGINPETSVPDVSHLPERVAKLTIANIKLDLANDAIRENKQFDWQDFDQDKVRGWFDLEQDDDVNPSGFRLYAVYYGNAFTTAGARLSFFSEEQLRHSFNTFTDLWEVVIKG